MPPATSTNYYDVRYTGVRVYLLPLAVSGNVHVTLTHGPSSGIYRTAEDAVAGTLSTFSHRSVIACMPMHTHDSRVPERHALRDSAPCMG